MQINRGNDVNLSGNKLDLKEEFIMLKDGESVKVRILGVEDYISYNCHNDFNLGVFPSPCSGEDDCVYCTAAKYPGFTKLNTSQRIVFAMADLVSGKVKLFDCSVPQARNIASQIKEYGNDIEEVAFNFKRSGKSKDTVYNLNPIIKMKGDEKAQFSKFDDIKEIETDFFLDRLKAKMSSKAFSVKLLMDKGFPVSDVFDAGLVADAKEIGKDKDLKPVSSESTLKDLV